MNVVDGVVIVLGAALIAGELWFFLGPRRGTPARRPAKGGVQEVRVTVRGGFDPDAILVEAGRPVRLLFYRDETAECSSRVVLDDFGINEPLPPFETTAVQFTPANPGDYPFTCGLGVMKGRVVAQVGRDGARANLGKGHATHG